jgi:hypothetical protein
MIDVHRKTATNGTAALAELDSLSPADPQTGKKMGEVMRRLVAMRNDLIAVRRLGTPCDAKLEQMNAILSSMFGVEFPSEGMQWQRVCDTRDALRRLLMDFQQADIGQL